MVEPSHIHTILQNNESNINNTKILENIVFYIKHNFVIVLEKENIIVGTLAATIDDTWYSDKKFLRTLWLHVLPKHRSYPAFRAIMLVLKEYSLKHNPAPISSKSY